MSVAAPEPDGVTRGKPAVARTSANQKQALDFVHDAVEWASDPGVEHGRCLYPGVSGFGSGYQFRQPQSDAGVGTYRVGAGNAAGDPLRERVRSLQAGIFWRGAWERQIELLHIQPGKPTQNAHVESFHGRLREECLNVSWFQNLFDAKGKIAAWRMEYNERRPHSSLGIPNPEQVRRPGGKLIQS